MKLIFDGVSSSLFLGRRNLTRDAATILVSWLQSATMWDAIRTAAHFQRIRDFNTSVLRGLHPK